MPNWLLFSLNQDRMHNKVFNLTQLRSVGFCFAALIMAKATSTTPGRLTQRYMPVKNFKFLLFLISLLTLVSCSKETGVEERVVFWKSELYKIIHTGTPQEEALNKLKEIDSEAFVNLLSGNISSKLENIESNDIPCKDWVLVATTEIQDNAVIKHSISSTGRCL